MKLCTLRQTLISSDMPAEEPSIEERLGLNDTESRIIAIESSSDGKNTNLPASGNKNISLYYPYNLVATTRLCKSSLDENSKNKEEIGRAHV